MLFRYTEIQKHRFNLKSKDSEADRQVPAMPLVFYTKEGKISRYEMKICSILSSKYLYILYIIIVSYTTNSSEQFEDFEFIFRT